MTFSFALVDQDRGQAARAFVADVLAPIERQGLAHVRTEPSLARGRADADRGKVAATFVIPAGFSAAVAAGRPAELRVLGDIDSPIGALVARSLAQSFAERGRRGARRRRGGPAEERGGCRAAWPRRPPPRRAPVTIADVSTTRKELDLGTYYAAGMAVFFLFFTVQFGVTSVLDERRDGTLARMFAAPIRRSAVLVGKLLTSLVLGS